MPGRKSGRLSQDDASLAIKQSLVDHGKILKSDFSYPMQDPFTPTVNIDTRMKDTLAALDMARQSIRS